MTNRNSAKRSLVASHVLDISLGVITPGTSFFLTVFFWTVLFAAQDWTNANAAVLSATDSESSTSVTVYVDERQAMIYGSTSVSGGFNGGRPIIIEKGKIWQNWYFEQIMFYKKNILFKVKIYCLWH